MNCLFWNTRGLESSSSRLHSLVKQWRVHILFVIEPMADCSKIDNYKKVLGLDGATCSDVNKIWVFWDNNTMTLSDFTWHTQFVHCKIHSNQYTGWATGVYGRHIYTIRRQLWDALINISQNNQGPWIVGGDFNEIAKYSEHKGKSLPVIRGVTEFSDCISACSLVDLPYDGPQYTWTGNRANGRVWRRLDRVLFNKQFLDIFDTIKVSILNSSQSDHSPILTQCSNTGLIGPKAFRFQNMWVKHDSFMGFVQEKWAAIQTGGGMRGLVNKLQALKKELKVWNKEIFGNIFDEIKRCENEVLEAEKEFQNNPNDTTRESWFHKKGLLTQKYKLERKFWKQKAHLHWLKEGDNNNHFFHSFVQIRKRKQCITSIKDKNDQLATSSLEIGTAAVNFFSNLYTEQKIDMNMELLSNIPQLITQEDNFMLTQIPNLEEVRNAVWELSQNSAPGPDGFHGKFYRKCWPIVCMDVLRATQDFFMGQHIPKGFSSTQIILIPKSDNPSTFSDFRPICLSNFTIKICTKVLATRLKQVLPKIISQEQAGFMAKRDIADQILIAQEMVHCIDKKVRGSNVIVKLDMAKAFDKVSWEFLSQVMTQFGFSTQLVHLIMNNLQATFLSVLINGSPHGFFKPTRGVKQGDPLSPFLFIIASEVFSRGLNKMVADGRIKPFWMGKQGLPISHLGFADDLLIFLNGEARSLVLFKKFLKDYQKASGQEINFCKSSIICGKSASRRINVIKNILEMKVSSLPIKYLGVNLHKGINRFNYCVHIINEFEKRLTPWKQKNLSQGGKLILIKHVLNAIPMHTLAVDKLPKKVVKILNCKTSSFFWGSSNNKRKYHWIRWSKLCLPNLEGGLGIRSLTDIEKAFTLKLWWKWRTEDSFWAKFIKSKYSRGDNMIPRVTDSTIWRRICSIHDLANTLVSCDDSGSLIWNEEHDGHFSFRSAFEEVREVSFNHSIYQNIWDSKQELKVKLLQWKIVKGIIPTADTLGRLNIVLNPSMCPLCRRASDSLDHLFYKCYIARRVWQYFIGIFGIYIPIGQDYTSFKYWRPKSSSTNLVGVFIHNIFGIVCWFLWKTYSNLVWGTGDVGHSAEQIILQIKIYTQSWVKFLSKDKIRTVGSILKEEHIIPNNFMINRPNIQIIKWQKHQRNKLNVDASYLSDKAFGGAILRDASGKMLLAVGFPIDANSALEAKLKAIVIATRWMIDRGFSDFLVESDCKVALDYLAGRETRRWKGEIQETAHLAIRKQVTFSHVYRDCNWVAHHMAAAHFSQIIFLESPSSLPVHAKRAYWMDLFDEQ
ncbi:unnamed protein product [Cuscuta epithymum]|uniref:Reverse transcriptase domain-containing protein n=1 Tax=Cuscuta epithymum TaxID=186058 RepID=A0AAV0DI80_9ASTE|nr:unnamed protein product [Cuscuta epithymum]